MTGLVMTGLIVLAVGVIGWKLRLPSVVTMVLCVIVAGVIVSKFPGLITSLHSVVAGKTARS